MAPWLNWWRTYEEDYKKIQEHRKKKVEERQKKVEEYRKKVAAARHLLLSEFFEATTGMVILPGLRDLQGGVLEETSAMLWWFQWYRHEPAPSEGEEIYGAIKQLRYEVLEYTMRCKKSWAEEYRLAKKLEPVLDRASKFLSRGKTASHGHAQMTKGRNTRVVSHKPEDSLDALSDGMIQFSDKTSPKRSLDIMNVVYPLYVSNFIYCSVHCPLVHPALSCCMMKCATVPRSIVGLYECGHISEKSKIQSANTGSACKDVHSLTEAEQENHCEKIMAYKFPMVHPWDHDLWTSAIDSFKYEDCTSYVRREGSCFQFSVETKVENTLLVSHKPDNSLDALSDGMVTEKTWLDGIDYYIKKIPYQGPVQHASRILQNGMDAVYPASHKDRTYSIRCELSYVQFSIQTSPKGGVYIKIGSYKKHVPKYGSVHSPLVQMVLFADSLYGATLACLKSMVPKSIVNIYESGLISEKPIPQSTHPNVDDLTDAEPENPGAPDSVDRRMCRNIGEEVKTAATWLIDTGAVHHATGKLSLMSDVRTDDDDDDLFMTARDGVRMRVHAQGSVVTDTVVLPDVWYIPGLTKNVVSASQLNQLGYSIGFTCGTCFIRSATDGTLIGKGQVSDDGLFEMDFLKVS